jgi:hypothetical protein
MIPSGSSTPILAGSPQKKHGLSRGNSFFSPEKFGLGGGHSKEDLSYQQSQPRYASPTRGNLMGDGGFGDTRKSVRIWSGMDRMISLMQIAGGAFMVLLSMRYAYRFTETTGIVLGALISASGLAGFFGSGKKSANWINLQVVASIVATLLAFQFLGEVSRDAQVDCALAELYHKTKASERAIQESQGHEAMQQVFQAIADMQESIDTVKEDAVNVMELRKEQNNLKFTDINYIRAKVAMVKKHAEEVLGSVLNNDDVSPESISKMPETQKSVLRKKLDMADKVLEKISKAHENGSKDLSIDEYREILLALTDASVVPELAANAELRQAMAELPNMEAALERKAKNDYTKLMVGAAGQQVKKAERRQMDRSKRFEGDFAKYLSKAASRGADFIADLPEHCMRETKGENLVMMSGWTMIGLQLVAVYVSLGLSLRCSAKSD